MTSNATNSFEIPQYAVKSQQDMTNFYYSPCPSQLSLERSSSSSFSIIPNLLHFFYPISPPSIPFPFSLSSRIMMKPQVSFRLALAFIPAILWLLLFSFGVALIPSQSRPAINVSLLPRLDHFIFSDSYSWFVQNPPNHFLDLLAAFPYTIHPILPFLFILATLPYASRRSLLPRFVFAFGVMNLSAVLTHLLFPTAPPWYFLKHGFEPADYAMKGDPGVLARVDQILNIQMFHKMYKDGGKVVFGAWPSLHAAWPYLIARFRPGFSQKVQYVLWAYMLLVWWAAVYLQHHFALDILGGILYAEMAYSFASFVYKNREVPNDKKDYLPVTVHD